MIILMALAGWLIGSTSVGAREVTQGQFEVQYNAFHSMFLEPDLANRYGLNRGPKVAMLNFVVIRHHDHDALGSPQEAEVIGHFTNLLSQRHNLRFQLVRDSEAIYYLADFRFTEGELLRFKCEVKVNGQVIPVSFQQKFYPQ